MQAAYAVNSANQKNKFEVRNMGSETCSEKKCEKSAINTCTNPMKCCNKPFCEVHFKKVHTPQGKLMACGDCKAKIKDSLDKGGDSKKDKKKKKQSSSDSDDSDGAKNYKRMMRIK